MKKLILLSLFLPLFATAQTIPNGNFESWFVVGFMEYPEFWETDNTESQTTVTKDFDSYEGEYAMRVTALPIGVGEYGEAYTIFDINYIPSTPLNFYAKYSCEFGGVGVEIKFFNISEQEIYTESWSSGGESAEDYTLISIPLTPFATPEDPPPTHARVRVSAEVGDFAPGNAWISVDAMGIDFPQSIEKLKRAEFEIFPNPASEKITIQSSQEIIGNLKIFDAQGKIVFEKRISDTSVDINIRKFSPGAYILRSDNLNFRASTFIVK